jgi:hypothetical protein
MLIILFDIDRNVHKNFVLEGQTVNSTYYCNNLLLLHENVRRLRPELWRQANWLLHHDIALSHTSFFTREFLMKTTQLSSPTHPIFLFPQLKIKPKGHHFDTAEVIEAESQVVLNILTEHDFQDGFKKRQKC